MKIEQIHYGMEVDQITSTGDRIYVGKIFYINNMLFVSEDIYIATVGCIDDDGNIKYFSLSNIEPHIEHITTDLLAEKLNKLEDIVDNEEFIFVAIEEMGELTQCLTKYLRANDENRTYDFDHLHEEFADVLVCMNHLKSIFGFDTQETRKRMLEKLDRAIERSK
jgi:NTP pyrophosphatase (non-canonical NTP hydrolase)